MVCLQVTITRAVFLMTGRFSVAKDAEGAANYDRFVDAVISREPGVPLLTVSNHRSVADDPYVMSVILPYHIIIQPRFLRYGLCSQEYCFNPRVPSAVHAYMGLGHVLPIYRGGGIDQARAVSVALRWCCVVLSCFVLFCLFSL